MATTRRVNVKKGTAQRRSIFAPLRDKDIPQEGSIDLFSEIKQDLSLNPSRSVEWYKSKVRELGTVTPSTLLGEKDRLMTVNSIGTMAFFRYDPKYKQELPYYDTFPLVIPFNFTDNGFMGLNLHYLPIKMRITLLDKLMVLSRDTRIGTEKRLRLSWQLLNASSRYREIQPCVKRYLTSHVESKFIFISSSEWKIAATLPVERFVGASINKVWLDSQRSIGAKR